MTVEERYEAHPNEWCEAHWDRQSKLVPVYKVGLCRECFDSKHCALKVKNPRPLREAADKFWKGFGHPHERAV